MERMSVNVRKISNHVTKEHDSNHIYDSQFFPFLHPKKDLIHNLTIAIFFSECHLFLFMSFLFAFYSSE